MLLSYLLKGTWHICNHSFQVQMCDIKGKYTEQICKKCGVHATTEYCGQLLIIVSPESNRPFRIGTWGINKKSTISIEASDKMLS